MNYKKKEMQTGRDTKRNSTQRQKFSELRDRERKRNRKGDLDKQIAIT